MGHVSGLEKYECVTSKYCMNLSSIDDGRVWWLRGWRGGGVANSCLGSDLMYQSIKKGNFVAKSCMGRNNVVSGGFIS